MRRIALVACVIAVALALTAMEPRVASQALNLDPSFGPAIIALRQAESAGATPAEITGLVNLLNRALALNREASRLNESQARVKLLEVEQILDTVTSQARALAIASSQRSYTERVLTYASGAIAAVVATLICAFVVLTYQEYRIRRIFQMKVRRR
jgi:predicted PurR-regulated permease PerM